MLRKKQKTNKTPVKSYISNEKKTPKKKSPTKPRTPRKLSKDSSAKKSKQTTQTTQSSSNKKKVTKVSKKTAVTKKHIEHYVVRITKGLNTEELKIDCDKFEDVLSFIYKYEKQTDINKITIEDVMTNSIVYSYSY